MTPDLGPGPRTRVRRLPEKARYDEATVFAIFDAAPFCHVGGVVDGRAVVLPTMHLRDGRTLYLHGSRSNALMRAVLDAGEACVTASIYDGVRLARSGFESSVAYRSVVAFGRVRPVGDAEVPAILDAFVDAAVPGRRSEVRPMTDRERRATMVVAIDIDEASVKLSAGPTSDDVEDTQLDIWSGVVPVRSVFAAPVPSFDGAMSRGDVAVPDSVRALYVAPDPETLERLGRQIDAIEPVNARERLSIEALRDRVTWNSDLFDERVDPRHVTASAFVVSERGVVLHRHRLLGIWVQPGGHVDAGESPEDAAVREVREETGLSVVHPGESLLFHVDVHQGPRGHTHYDLRYLLVGDDRDPAPGPGESPEVLWLSFDDAIERAEPALRAPLDKLRAFVTGDGRATLER